MNGGRRQGVTAGGAPVDDHDRDAAFRGVPDEPQAGHHRERRPEHQQGRRSLDQLEAPCDALLRDVLAEEHHIGLERPSAVAARHGERLGLVQLDITVGPHGCVRVPVQPLRVELGHPTLKGPA